MVTKYQNIKVAKPPSGDFSEALQKQSISVLVEQFKTYPELERKAHYLLPPSAYKYKDHGSFEMLPITWNQLKSMGVANGYQIELSIVGMAVAQEGGAKKDVVNAMCCDRAGKCKMVNLPASLVPEVQALRLQKKVAYLTWEHPEYCKYPLSVRSLGEDIVEIKECHSPTVRIYPLPRSSKLGKSMFFSRYCRLLK